jgi:UDP-N-acetylglucosamine transferase subunit ALG13
MIKVALGTEKFPMVKVLEWIDQAIDEGYIPKDEEIRVQSGSTVYTPRNANITMTPTVPFPIQMQDFKDARMSIIHAGMGNVLDLADLNKVPIVIPRDPRLGEHLDGHQLDFCTVAEKELDLPIVYRYSQFVEAIKNYQPVRSFPSFKKQLVEFLISAVES